MVNQFQPRFVLVKMVWYKNCVNEPLQPRLEWDAILLYYVDIHLRLLMMQGSPNYFRNYFIMKHHKRTGHLVMCENSRYENTTFRSFLVFSWYFWHPLICMVSWHFKREVEGGSFFLVGECTNKLGKKKPQSNEVCLKSWLVSLGIPFWGYTNNCWNSK